MRSEVDQLLVFCRVARLRSFTKAAEELCLTQPAVSAQVARLEKRLKTKLIDRLGRYIYLTEAGRLLYSYAQQVERLCTLLEEAEQAVSELETELSGKLAVGASTTIAIYMLPPLLAEFKRLHPKVEFALAVGTSRGIMAELVNNTHDFALLEGPIDMPGVHFEHFWFDVLHLIVARSHRWAKRTKEGVAIEELAQEPFISHRQGSGVQTAIQRELTRHGVQIVPSMVIDNIEVVKKSVEAGLGVSILSKLVLQREIEGGTLVVVPVRDAS
ncbi:MAG: LysR substrate-binding domain-containing protein, partial [Chloroflexi bacterium]|nr:LysR substrate-binding domain-containing protein [Chloroflexota bacterium]